MINRLFIKEYKDFKIIYIKQQKQAADILQMSCFFFMPAVYDEK